MIVDKLGEIVYNLISGLLAGGGGGGGGLGGLVLLLLPLQLLPQFASPKIFSKCKKKKKAGQCMARIFWALSRKGSFKNSKSN